MPCPEAQSPSYPGCLEGEEGRFPQEWECGGWTLPHSPQPGLFTLCILLCTPSKRLLILGTLVEAREKAERQEDGQKKPATAPPHFDLSRLKATDTLTTVSSPHICTHLFRKRLVFGDSLSLRISWRGARLSLWAPDGMG